MSKALKLYFKFGDLPPSSTQARAIMLCTIAELTSQGRWIGTHEIRDTLGYTGYLRNIQRYLVDMSAISKGLLVSDGHNPQGWRNLGTFEQLIKAMSSVKREDVKREDVKREDVKREDVKREDVKREDVKREDVKRGDVKRGDVKREDVKRGDVKREDVKREDEPENPTQTEESENV